MFSKITVTTSIRWPKWWYNQSAQLLKDIASSSFNSLPCLGYDIFEVGVHFPPLASWTPSDMQRGELREKLKFQWRNDFFLKKLELNFTLQNKRIAVFKNYVLHLTLCAMLLNSNGKLILELEAQTRAVNWQIWFAVNWVSMLVFLQTITSYANVKWGETWKSQNILYNCRLSFFILLSCYYDLPEFLISYFY